MPNMVRGFFIVLYSDMQESEKWVESCFFTRQQFELKNRRDGPDYCTCRQFELKNRKGEPDYCTH